MKTGRVMQVRSAIVIATWCLLPLPHFAKECTAQEAQATETPQSERVVDETIQLHTILERAGVTPVRTRGLWRKTQGAVPTELELGTATSHHRVFLPTTATADTAARIARQ